MNEFFITRIQTVVNFWSDGWMEGLISIIMRVIIELMTVINEWQSIILELLDRHRVLKIINYSHFIHSSFYFAFILCCLMFFFLFLMTKMEILQPCKKLCSYIYFHMCIDFREKNGMNRNISNFLTFLVLSITIFITFLGIQ